MWKNNEERENSSKELAEEFKQIFEKALLEKDINLIDIIIKHLTSIKQVWEFQEDFKSGNVESFFKMLDKITSQTKNKKEKN